MPKHLHHEVDPECEQQACQPGAMEDPVSAFRADMWRTTAEADRGLIDRMPAGVGTVDRGLLQAVWDCFKQTDNRLLARKDVVTLFMHQNRMLYE